jgi:hypothetical protein
LLSDSTTVAIINEALAAPSRSRRVAAGILLDMIRTRQTFDHLVEDLEKVRADEGLVVTLQMHRLVRQYELDGPADPPPHLP